MNTPVSFPVAKLLKEKGFDKYCHSGYTEKGNIYLHQGGQLPVKNGRGYYEGRSYNGGEFYCSAPTIADVVMWLYEKHGVWIYAECDVNGNFYPKIYFSKEENWLNLELRSKMNEGNRVICRKEYKSPTEAYEAAITYTLNTLI